MKKERKLDRLYVEFDKEYSGKSEEEMAKIISNLEKEVAGKESAIESLEGDRKENLQKGVEQSKKRLENLRGYSKNKTQIEGIRKYKESLVQKLEKQITIRDESSELLKQARKEYEEVSKKLSDEKYAMTLTQDEYYNLVNEKARAEKSIAEQSEMHLKAKTKVLELQTKIGKCDLAWKTLFVNKSWDDIQRISVEQNTRFTRKVNSEKEELLSNKKEENLSSKNEEQQSVNDKENSETTALVVKKDGLLKRIWNSAKNWVNKWVNGKKENSTIESENKIDAAEEKVINTERDSFLEGLRLHVDKEYKNAVGKEKDIQYKEAHKVQNRKEVESEQEETK